MWLNVIEQKEIEDKLCLDNKVTEWDKRIFIAMQSFDNNLWIILQNNEWEAEFLSKIKTTHNCHSF